MASKNEFRISKDTSARKSITPSTMHNALEAAAKQAADEAYTQAMFSGYEAEIESLKSAHAAEMGAINNERDSAIRFAMESARNASTGDIAKLKHEVAELLKGHESLRNTTDDMLAKHKTELLASKRQIGTVNSQMDSLKHDHNQEVTRLQKKIRYEIRFSTKGRKSRTYFCKLASPLREVATKLAQDTHISGHEIKFVHKSRAILNLSKRLQEVGFHG